VQAPLFLYPEGLAPRQEQIRQKQPEGCVLRRKARNPLRSAKNALNDDFKNDMHEKSAPQVQTSAILPRYAHCNAQMKTESSELLNPVLLTCSYSVSETGLMHFSAKDWCE